MPLTEKHRAEIYSLIDAACILDSTSPRYRANSVAWSTAYEKQPQLVLVPSSIESLQKIIKYLYQTTLDFAIRGSGCGNSSASDVVVSLQAFNNVDFDAQDRVVHVGAGLTLAEIEGKLLSLAPGFSVVGSRCSFVGVTGSTLTGGLSWMSHELGLASDPQNFLDAYLVLFDGRALWASQEPDLLWALRGGGGNFGVVTTLKLRAHAYSTKIYAGMIHYPASALEHVSKRAAVFAKTISDPKLAMHIIVTDFIQQTLHSTSVAANATIEPQIVAIIFDAHGEDHARSESGFKWALDIEGAKVDCREMTLPEVNNIQRNMEETHGMAESWYQAALVQSFDENTVKRGRDWYMTVQQENPDLLFGTFFLLEIMQERAFTSAPPSSTAWPHGYKGRQHVIQLGIGAAKDQTPAEKRARETRALSILAEAPAKITGRDVHPPEDFLPNFYLPHLDLSKMFGQNWAKLQELKRKYDPDSRFNKGLPIQPTG